jgi:hypothetical protein
MRKTCRHVYPLGFRWIGRLAVLGAGIVGSRMQVHNEHVATMASSDRADLTQGDEG